MPGRGKTKIVDGFTTLKAIQRRDPKTADEVSEMPQPADAGKSDSGKASRGSGKGISHTVMPTRFEIICYDCGFEFKVTGRADYTFCPKCRKRLDRTDHVISGAITEDVTTAGKIHLTPDASLESATLIAGELILDGTAKSGLIQVNGKLEIGPKASFSEKNINARDLCVPVDSRITLRRKSEFRNVEIHGALRARITTTGVVIIKSGGLFRGEICSPRMVVEEGGGLIADAAINQVYENTGQEETA